MRQNIKRKGIVWIAYGRALDKRAPRFINQQTHGLDVTGYHEQTATPDALQYVFKRLHGRCCRKVQVTPGVVRLNRKSGSVFPCSQKR
jgi:hypothetical protein